MSPPAKLGGYAGLHWRGDPATDSVFDTGSAYRFAPGCFRRALRNPVGLYATFGHDHDNRIAHVADGTLKVWADDVGLAWELTIPGSSRGALLRLAVERGEVRGSSFTYRVRRTCRVPDPDRVIELVTDLELVEIGPTAYPRVPAATCWLLTGRPDVDAITRALAGMVDEPKGDE